MSKNLTPEQLEKRKNTNKKILKFGCLPILVIFFLIGLLTKSSTDNKTANASGPDNKKIESLDSAKIDFRDAEQIKRDSIDLANWEKTKAGKIFKKHPEWTKDECENVADNKIWIGMSYEMLLCERGKPNTVNTSNYGKGNEYQACWEDYNPSCYYFGEDHIVKSYN